MKVQEIGILKSNGTLCVFQISDQWKCTEICKFLNVYIGTVNGLLHVCPTIL